MNDKGRDEEYANIRELLGEFINQRVSDITQHDAEEFEQRRDSFISLHFEKGKTLTFKIGDGGFSCVVQDGDNRQWKLVADDEGDDEDDD